MPETAQVGFGLESEMAPPVSRWLRLRGLAVKSEFALPWGICDLVGVKLNRVRLKHRLSYGQTQPIGPVIRLHILSKIPDSETGRSISLKKLEQDFSGEIPLERLSLEIDRLQRTKFVTSPKSGFFQKRNGWAPLQDDIVAVELKLERVSDVLAQAVSNRAFASKSYVALPAVLALRLAASSRADLFRQRGIGLLAVWRHKCQELLRPESNQDCHEILQSHVVERFWRTRGN